MREIPSLQILCLRSIGPHACSAESTFAPNAANESDTNKGNNEPSLASYLLRSFHANKFLDRTPCIGPGSARRFNANEIDIFHPLGAEPFWTEQSPSEYGNAATDGVSVTPAASRADCLVSGYGNVACDVLQSFIDSLVELGRMDDQRLGLHFFEEWKKNVLLSAESDESADGDGSTKVRRKRKRLLNESAGSKATPLGALSLYNCNVAQDTFESMHDAKIGPHLATLDLSGIRGLTNDLLDLILPDCPNLRHLSIKNCRRLTHINVVGKHQKQLTTLDIGGSFNIDTDHVLQTIPQLPWLTRLHAGGLGWTDESLRDLVESRGWQHLSLSFSLTLTPGALRHNIAPLAETLTCLAVAFCETVIDNAAMGLLGRNLPLVRALDVRGNPGLTTLTGWYDGRVSADLPAQPLSVLARYSGLTEASVEETKRVHPLETMGLIVILDAGGMGAAIYAEQDE